MQTSYLCVDTGKNQQSNKFEWSSIDAWCHSNFQQKFKNYGNYDSWYFFKIPARSMQRDGAFYDSTTMIGYLPKVYKWPEHTFVAYIFLKKCW